MNPRTEKAIAEWLKLPRKERRGGIKNLAAKNPSVILARLADANQPNIWEPIATFTIESIISKRFARRKKKPNEGE